MARGAPGYADRVEPTHRDGHFGHEQVADTPFQAHRARQQQRDAVADGPVYATARELPDIPAIPLIALSPSGWSASGSEPTAAWTLAFAALGGGRGITRPGAGSWHTCRPGWPG